MSSSRLSLFVCVVCVFQDLNAHHNTTVLCFPLLQSCATSSSNIVCHAFHLALCGPVCSPAEHQWARSAHGALCLFLLTEFQCRTAMGLRCRAVGDDVAQVSRVKLIRGPLYSRWILLFALHYTLLDIFHSDADSLIQYYWERWIDVQLPRVLLISVVDLLSFAVVRVSR